MMPSWKEIIREITDGKTVEIPISSVKESLNIQHMLFLAGCKWASGRVTPFDFTNNITTSKTIYFVVRGNIITWENTSLKLNEFTGEPDESIIEKDDNNIQDCLR